MSTEAEDVVASALANALHATGVEAVVLLSIRDGRVTRRIDGDPEKATRMAVRYAASLMAETAQKLTAETEEAQG
jgi:hypothetical protein